MQSTVTHLDGCPIPEVLKFKFLCEPSPPAPFFLEGGDEKQGLLLKARLSSLYLPDTDAARIFQCTPTPQGQLQDSWKGGPLTAAAQGRN